MWHKGFLTTIVLLVTRFTFSYVVAEKLIYGWIPDAPYEYVPSPTSAQSNVRLTGLDVELVRFLGKQMGLSVEFKEIQRKKALTLLQEGHIDFIGGKTQLPPGTQGLALTIPYRTQEDAFFTRKDNSLKETFKTVPDLIKFLDKTQMRVAYIKNYQYADARINTFLDEKAQTNTKQFIGVVSEEDGMTQLIEKEVQGFIVDRLSGMTIAWESGQAGQVASHGVDFQQNIHFMVGTKWVTPALLQKMNKGIETFKKTDVYSNLLAPYLYPLIIQKALDTWWFITLQYIGVIAASWDGYILLVAWLCQLDNPRLNYGDPSHQCGEVTLLPYIRGGVYRVDFLSLAPLAPTLYFLFAILSPYYKNLHWCRRFYFCD